MSYKQEILKLRAEGKTYDEIQQALGCSKSTISFHCGTRRREEYIPKTCKMCDATVKSGYTYCTEHVSEYRKHKRESKIKDWLDGEWAGGTKSGLSDIVRSYLLEECDYKCIKCGFDTPHPDDGKTILEINHINGDGTDHARSNLEVLCPNCHALTSSYRARNKGNGRPQYYIRRSR